MAKSVEQRAANGEDADELFPTGMVDGDGKSLKTLIPAGATVKSTVSLMAGEVPAASGIFDPGREGRLLVSFELANVVTIPMREEGRVVSWKIRQSIKPTFIERVGVAGSNIEAAFAELLSSDPNAAGKLLDAMQKRASAELQPA